MSLSIRSSFSYLSGSIRIPSSRGTSLCTPASRRATSTVIQLVKGFCFSPDFSISFIVEKNPFQQEVSINYFLLCVMAVFSSICLAFRLFRIFLHLYGWSSVNGDFWSMGYPSQMLSVWPPFDMESPAVLLYSYTSISSFASSQELGHLVLICCTFSYGEPSLVSHHHHCV